jgi:hypothetical protein
MKPRCPDCCSSEIERIAELDSPARRTTYAFHAGLSEDDFYCSSCGTALERASALVTLADAEAYADAQRICTCDELRGCPQCFQRAEELIGATVRDCFDREWEVIGVDEKDGFPTIGGETCWGRPDEVTVLRAAT